MQFYFCPLEVGPTLQSLSPGPQEIREQKLTADLCLAQRHRGRKLHWHGSSSSSSTRRSSCSSSIDGCSSSTCSICNCSLIRWITVESILLWNIGCSVTDSNLICPKSSVWPEVRPDTDTFLIFILHNILFYSTAAAKFQIIFRRWITWKYLHVLMFISKEMITSLSWS